MKKFICKVLGFVAIFALIVLALYMVNRWFGNFRIDSGKHILVIGNSHPECAFNDELIPEAVNFSESGDTYFYTYIKAKKLIDENPQIDKILIEFSSTQMQRYMDEWIWADMYVSYRFPKYGPFMSGEDFALLYKNNPEGVRKAVPLMSKTNANMLLRYKLNYARVMGGHLALDKNRVDSLAVDQAASAPAVEERKELSVENLEYLDKLIKYSEENRVEVFFIRSPVHERYSGKRDERFFQDARQSLYPGIEFLDFAGFPLPDSEYADLDHLNYKGAKKFSRWFSSLLEQGLFDEADKQKFIDDQAEAFSAASGD